MSYIYFEKAHIDLTYGSDYYKMGIKNQMLTIKNFFFFGYVQLNDCINITNKLTKINGQYLIKFTYFPWR